MASMTSKRVAYIVSTELIKFASLLPSNKKRSLIVHGLIKSLGLLDPNLSSEAVIQTYTPRKATRQDLAMYHTHAYLDFILNPAHSAESEPTGNNTDPEFEALKTEFGLEDDCPLFVGLPDYVQLIAGATLTAVDALRYNVSDIAINWDGGRHHTSKARAAGFCYVADCVLAILALKTIPRPPASKHQSQGEPTKSLPRVFYLDLDLHFSDVVASAFTSFTSSGAPRLMTLSIHHTSPGFFPISPRAELPDPSAPWFDPFSLSIPLREGASNKTYAAIWGIVEELKDTMEPDYIIVQCGTDALAGDPCTTFNWSLGEGEGSLAWCMSRIINEWRGKKLLLGGGGYNSPNAARAWAYITSIALGRPLDLETDIPDHPGFPLYAPSFTLNVSPGNMRDHNTTDHLDNIKARFDKIFPLVRQRMGNGEPKS